MKIAVVGPGCVAIGTPPNHAIGKDLAAYKAEAEAILVNRRTPEWPMSRARSLPATRSALIEAQAAQAGRAAITSATPGTVCDCS